MSTIRANTITDTAGTGAPTFTNGIISNGNVGIGTSSPTAKLDVRGFSLLGMYGGTYQGVTLRNNDDSSVSQTTSFIDSQNNLATADTNIFFSHQTDGGSSMGFATTPAGSRSTDRRVERVRIDANGNLQFNSGYGSVATAYGCRAWVNFNGTGTVAIRASGNVTSITDNGVGDYTVNFTTAMPDASYAVNATSADLDTANIWNNQAATSSSAGYMTASSVRIATTISGAQGDTAIATVSVFR